MMSYSSTHKRQFSHLNSGVFIQVCKLVRRTTKTTTLGVFTQLKFHLLCLSQFPLIVISHSLSSTFHHTQTLARTHSNEVLRLQSLFSIYIQNTLLKGLYCTERFNKFSIHRASRKQNMEARGKLMSAEIHTRLSCSKSGM